MALPNAHVQAIGSPFDVRLIDRRRHSLLEIASSRTYIDGQCIDVAALFKSRHNPQLLAHWNFSIDRVPVLIRSSLAVPISLEVCDEHNGDGYAAPIDPSDVDVGYDDSLVDITVTASGQFEVIANAGHGSAVVTIAVGQFTTELPVTIGAWE